jgi:hypothetical protein
MLTPGDHRVERIRPADEKAECLLDARPFTAVLEPVAVGRGNHDRPHRAGSNGRRLRERRLARGGSDPTEYTDANEVPPSHIAHRHSPAVVEQFALASRWLLAAHRRRHRNGAATASAMNETAV